MNDMIDIHKPDPLVSIGIPTYNRPHGLRNTLECATRQSYKNIEIIVSDNCSEEQRSVDEVVNTFLTADPRIRFYRQKRNIGAKHNFEFLLRAAKGEYFIWMTDDDDYSDPEFISTGVEELQKKPNAVFAYGTVVYIDKEGDAFITDTPPYGLNGTAESRISRYIRYDITDHLVYSLFRSSAVADFVFHKHCTTPEKLLILDLLIKGALAENPKMYYRNNYSFKSDEEIRAIGIRTDGLANLAHHLLWYKKIMQSFPIMTGLKLCSLYTAFRLPKVSWPFRKILGIQIQQLNSRKFHKDPVRGD